MRGFQFFFKIFDLAFLLADANAETKAVHPDDQRADDEPGGHRGQNEKIEGGVQGRRERTPDNIDALTIGESEGGDERG